MAFSRTGLRTFGVGLRAVLVFTVVLGVIYPAAVTLVGTLVMPHQAKGSLITNADGQVVGSSLIGQSFADQAGNPLPQYFQPRPSAAGEGYDAAQSGASNMGTEHPELIEAVTARRAEVAAFNGVDESQVPADAVTASSSGLDPHISPAYAELQVERVARERSMSADEVRALVTEHTQGPDLGFLGAPRVNVVTLNLALDERKG